MFPAPPQTHLPPSLNTGTKLEMFQDVAMAFENDDGTKSLWFGRLQKLLLARTYRSRTTRKVLLDAVPINDLPEGLQVMARYYTAVPRKRRTFKYGVAADCGPEAKAYNASCVLHVVEFDYNSDRDEYTLDRGQWDIVQTKLRSI